MKRLDRWGLLLLFVESSACSSRSRQPEAPAAPLLNSASLAADRCMVAADADNPLVTEWPASEKAHLESLLSSQIVAVEYSGCELRIVPGCRMLGSYVWSETTLATDTVNIDSADELYAKLPIGALALEAELERSGHLAVQTTVSGQLRLQAADVEVPETGPCSDATHWVSALSVGAFKLYSGVSSGADTSLDTVLGEASAGKAYEQSILREAGDKRACGSATESAPHPQCASPIQLFLEPVGRKEEYAQTAQARQTGAVRLSLSAPAKERESWTLRDPGGTVLCVTPCQYWVPPKSGFYVQREATSDTKMATVALPPSFAVEPGSSLDATYRAKRGAPLTSKILFIGLGVPLTIGGVYFSALATRGFLLRDCDGDCKQDRNIQLTVGLSYLAVAGGLYGWFSWSHKAGFEVAPESGQDSTSRRAWVGPGFVRGTF